LIQLLLGIPNTDWNGHVIWELDYDDSWIIAAFICLLQRIKGTGVGRRWWTAVPVKIM